MCIRDRGKSPLFRARRPRSFPKSAFFFGRQNSAAHAPRVRHRRADLVRVRRVFSAKGELLRPNEAELELLCQAGLYVKELVSGDQGGTEPSLSGLLGVDAQVVELDVLDILEEPGVVAEEAVSYTHLTLPTIYSV